jgi:hypothetical protein
VTQLDSRTTLTAEVRFLFEVRKSWIYDGQRSIRTCFIRVYLLSLSMAQYVSHRPLNAKVWTRLQLSPCGFVIDNFALRQVCFPVRLFCLVRIVLSVLYIHLYLVLLLTGAETIKAWKSFENNTLLEIGRHWTQNYFHWILIVFTTSLPDY